MTVGVRTEGSAADRLSVVERKAHAEEELGDEDASVTVTVDGTILRDDTRGPAQAHPE